MNHRASSYFHKASPLGEGGIALLELYGEGAAGVLQAICRHGGGLPAPGQSRRVGLVDEAGEPLDEALLSLIPGGSAWSGLDTWTLSVHGGLWIPQRVGECLAKLGIEELTTDGVLRRALETGALDAIQAAAYKLLVEARTEKAARFFLRQRHGELSSRIREAMSLLEGGERQEYRALLEGLAIPHRPAYRLGSPLSVLIAGPTNAGKSTLFNRLVEEERAAVTPVPGTTRDFLEEMIALEDYPVLLKDSAGLRPLHTVGPIERDGIRRVFESTQDVVLYLVPYPWDLSAGDREFLARQPRDARLVVASVSDLEREGKKLPGALSISALTGDGIDALKRAIVGRWIDDREPPSDEVPCAPFTRHQKECLSRALADADPGANLDAVRCALVESLLHTWPES